MLIRTMMIMMTMMIAMMLMLMIIMAMMLMTMSMMIIIMHCRKRPWEGALYKWLTRSASDAMHMALYK